MNVEHLSLGRQDIGTIFAIDIDKRYWSHTKRALKAHKL